MEHSHSEIPVAQVLRDWKAGALRVNKDYQRGSDVWPTGPRSYLIDTILSGVPMPKFTWHQRLEGWPSGVGSGVNVVNEIVDGQQRTRAIADYVNGEFRLSRGDFKGLKFEQLQPDDQRRILEYRLSVDTITGVDDSGIRDMFRRMNAYSAPLNSQEDRHAHYQGEFKWCISELAIEYGETLGRLKVFSPRALTRMADGQFFTAIYRTLEYGIETHSQSNLDAVYKRFDSAFSGSAAFLSRVERAMRVAVAMEDLHESPLFRKEAVFFTLFLAITHVHKPVDKLMIHRKLSKGRQVDIAGSVQPLARLADALADPDAAPKSMDRWIKASTAGTNTKDNRAVRFKKLVTALVEG